MSNDDINQIVGVGPKAAETLRDNGFNTIEKISQSTAEELSQLPGIGAATARKMIDNAKTMISLPAKKEVSKTKVAKVEEPPVKKPVVAKKPPVKKPVVAKKPPVKKPTVAKKPPVKKVKKVKKLKAGKQELSATQKAIAAYPKEYHIKLKRVKPKTQKKKTKAVSIKQTFGIVKNVMHDGAGKSSNRAIVVSLYNTEIPLEDYLGRKVEIQIPQSVKKYVGKITQIHGKRLSENQNVVVRFPKSVSPHIIAAKAKVF